MAIEGSLSIGALVAINMYFVGLQAPFHDHRLPPDHEPARGRFVPAHLRDLRRDQSEIEDREGAEDIEISDGRVEFDNVSFGYADGDECSETDLDLKIEPGETVAVVGRTGCGKSTLMRLLPRFYDVRRGAVRIDGVDVRDVRVESLRREIGLVLDEPFLFSESIHDNIAYARPDATRHEVEEAARRADAHRFVSELEHGYDTVIGERGYTLSGGQRQRIAIARTLLANPRILVLDDATSSLDVKVEQQIHDALRNLFEGRTTLIIAHRLSTIALAKRVVLLDQGRIVADGTHEELLRTVAAYAEILTREEEE